MSVTTLADECTQISSSFLAELFPHQYSDLIQTALQEDLARGGDLTSQALIPLSHESELFICARETGVLAGSGLASAVFAQLDERVRVDFHSEDGAQIHPGQVLARVQGPTRSILAGERTALNFLGHLSGVATATADLCARVHPYDSKITCTRKTLPGLRALQKYAVRVGGGYNHRLALDDAVLIKDNHIALAGGIAQALEKARKTVGHMVAIEIEVDNLVQLDEALEHGAKIILLDNMDPDTLLRAVRKCADRAVTEASGGITPERINEIAATGVDYISVGWLTHSARNLDLGLDVL
ncbi:MAG TPA: carboxylating nicotinate-nucleotide diphosphorylase [Paenalcaligenes sp.]|nr:carboxylating nicotinate-nucleotide diphosphorylase [Paenalcaligenes sp.]